MGHEEREERRRKIGCTPLPLQMAQSMSLQSQPVIRMGIKILRHAHGLAIKGMAPTDRSIRVSYIRSRAVAAWHTHSEDPFQLKCDM